MLGFIKELSEALNVVSDAGMSGLNFIGSVQERALRSMDFMEENRLPTRTELICAMALGFDLMSLEGLSGISETVLREIMDS